MKAIEFDILFRIRGELERIQQELKEVWAEMDFRLGTDDYSEQLMTECVNTGRAWHSAMNARKALECKEGVYENPEQKACNELREKLYELEQRAGVAS